MGENILFGKPPFEIMTSVKNRISFLYCEYGLISRENNSLIFTQNGKSFDLPVATLASILIGPGVSITQPAILEISRWGCTICFVSGGGLKLHASFIASSSRNAKLANKQALLTSNPVLRLAAARKMYSKRWGEENVPKNYSINKLMVLEGRRVKKIYETNAKAYKVLNFRRVNQPDDSDQINKTLTILNNLLYGVVASVVTTFGMSPYLGIIHHGNAQSFIFDIADLYKENLIIPLAFEQASVAPFDSSEIRKIFRERIVSYSLFEKIIDDIYDIMGLTGEDRGPFNEESLIWSPKSTVNSGGYNLDVQK